MSRRDRRGATSGAHYDDGRSNGGRGNNRRRLGQNFLKDGWDIPDGRQAVTIEDVVIAIDHVCQVVGDARHVGLGSDFDGGFGLNKAPSGLDSIADLRLIGDALRARGYGQDDVDAILAQNWLNTLYTALPES